MKYRLTITQVTTKQYLNARTNEKDTYDDRQSVNYESENLGDLLFIIQTSESVNPSRVEYKIEKVEEE